MKLTEEQEDTIETLLRDKDISDLDIVVVYDQRLDYANRLASVMRHK